MEGDLYKEKYGADILMMNVGKLSKYPISRFVRSELKKVEKRLGSH